MELDTLININDDNKTEIATDNDSEKIECIEINNLEGENSDCDSDRNKYNEYMHILYSHPSVTVCEENGYKYVKTTSDIKFGELLIVEHVYCDNNINSHLVVGHNDFLFNAYYPRSKPINDEDKMKLTGKKIQYNAFGNAEINILTYLISNINHSCDPTCGTTMRKEYKHDDIYVIFMEIYSIKPIKEGTELTINYRADMGHEHKNDFICTCGKDLLFRQKKINIIKKLIQTLSQNNYEMVSKKICEYLETSISSKIILNHQLANKGIFMNKNTIGACTKKGEKMVNDIIYRSLGLTENNDNQKNIAFDPKVNTQKINLFLQIMNENLMNIDKNFSDLNSLNS